jgi:GNAT superfamily N-acetyltransferase
MSLYGIGLHYQALSSLSNVLALVGEPVIRTARCTLLESDCLTRPFLVHVEEIAHVLIVEKNEEMAPRLRHHRIGLETLKRELQLVDVSTTAPSSSSSSSSALPSSPLLAVKDLWKGTFRLDLDSSGRGREFTPTATTLQSTAVGDKIPGFRTSATFFTSLRTNLHLGVSPPPSPMSSIPPSMTASASSIGPPSPLQDAADVSSEVPESPLAGIPELRTFVTKSEEEKLAALKLVADGVAQMRQTANRILMYNPYNLAAFFGLLAIVGGYLYKERSDIGIVLTTSAGLLMAAMVTVRRFTNPYITIAEETNVNLLDEADVLVTKFGDEVIGTVIIGWVDGDIKGKRRKWRAEIRGWAVRLRYRGQGEGLALLEEAVSWAKKKDADGIEFAPDHASEFLKIHPFCPVNSLLIYSRFEACSLGLLQRTF